MKKSILIILIISVLSFSGCGLFDHIYNISEITEVEQYGDFYPLDQNDQYITEYIGDFVPKNSNFFDYEYDSAGNLVVEQSSSGRCTYTYDAQGNKTQMIVYENNGEIFKTDYRYDSYGNLLMIEEHYDDNTVRIYSKYQLYYDPYVQNDFRQLLK